MSRCLPLPATNAKTAKSPHFVRAKLTAAVIAATQLILAGNAWAAPQGGQVVGGQGIIHQNGTDTRVNQASERMAIDWQSFDVGANERVEFIQPSSSSIALNRVLSNSASQILGRIDANGQVMLVNPNGVVFGKDSVINVGGLIASGMSIDPDSFINGDYTLNSLDGTEGKVINYGIINAATGGSVSLVGKQVENQGLISASLGAVNMVAGKQAVLTFDNAGLVGVKVTQAVLQSELGVDAAVVNSGEINAQGGRVLLTASQSEDIFSNAVNNGGMNRDQSVVVHDDGTFTLGEGADLVNTGDINTSIATGNAGHVVMLGENITSSGQIKADATSGNGGAIEIHSRDTTRITENAQVSAQAIASGKGGDIKLLGDKVGVFDNAQASVAAANGGGQLLVGGDKTGANKKIRNAEFIYIDQNTLLDASATLNGDGGKLITFASDTARIYGYLKARGGELAGGGGFIETSGLLGFEILNVPDAGATSGKGGLWLIDPIDLTIDNNNTGGSISGGEFTSGSKTTIKASDVADALALQDVKLITGGGTSGTGKITVKQDINYIGVGQSKLTLQAHNGITIDSNISSSAGKLNLNLIADSDANGSGGITISDGVYISTRGGDFKATGTSFTGATSTSSVSHIYTGAYTTNGNNPTYAYQAGDININVGTGDAVLGEFNIKHNPSDAANSISAIGSISVNAGNISLLGSFNYNDSGSRSAGGSSVINFTPDADPYSANNRNPFLKLVATNNISIKNHIYESHGDARDGLRIDLSAGSAITLGASSKSVQIYTGGGNFIASSASFDSTYGSINTEDPNTQIAGVWNASAPNPQNDDPAGWSEGGDVSITADGTIILGSITTDGHATSGTPTGNLTITRKSNSASANLTQASGSSLNIFGISSFDLGSAGNITLNNAGNNFIGQLRITSANDVGISDADNYQYNLGGNTKQSVAHDFNLGTSNIAGNFSLIANSDVSQSTTTGEGLTVSGTTTINANTNDITLANVENSFIGTISVSNATDLTLKSAGGIIVNPLTIATGGMGNIDLGVASGNISLQGTYDSSAGTEGNITLTGDVILTGDTTLKAGTSAVPDIRKVTITGTLDSVDTNKRTISITGNELSFQKDWGSTNSLGAVNLYSTNATGASGSVSFNTGDETPVAVNITATGFNLNSANSFYAGDIDVSETGNSIGITAGNIEVGDLNTSNTSGGGGAITLVANSAETDKKYIKINGDLNAQGSTSITNGSINLTLTNTSANGSVELNYSDFFSSDINVTGNGAQDTLVGLAKNSSWSITSPGVGAITDTGAVSPSTISFTGIENLMGSSADDTFTFTGSGAISGLVSGGAGANILDISAIASNYIVAVNDATDAGADLRVDGIGFFKGNASAAQELKFNSSAGDAVNWFIYKFVDSVLTSTDGSNDGVIVADVKTYKFTDFSQVTGGDGDDAFYFDRDEAITPNLTDASNQGSITNTINGGGGTNTLVGRNVDTLWSITGEYSGNTALLDTPASEYIASFSNIQSLLGTESKDTFVFSDSSKITSADGGATGHTNTANLSAINSDVTVTLGVATDFGFSNVSVLIGNASQTFTLAATSGTNTWTIKDFDGVGGSVADGVNDGTVGSIQFVDFKKLQGGSGIDTFNINSNFAGSIKGGDEADVFNISAAAGSLDGQTGDDTFVFFDGGSITSGVGGADFNTLDLHNLSSAYEVAVDGTSVDSITDIGRVIANSALEFTLKTSTGVNTWTIYDFDGAGSVADGVNDGTVGTVQFVDFKNLQGGDGVDTFNIDTDFSGSIKGGAEADVFNIRATAGSVVGEDGDDSFVFFDSGSLSSGSGNGGLNSVDLSNLTAAETVTLSGTTVKGVTGVGRVIANAGLNFTLQAASGTNTWTIYDFDGAGSVSDGVNDGEVGGMQFVNFKNLQGGDGVDTFNINTDFSGSIKGGSEADVFNISAVVGSLDGEAGDDSFVFFDSGSLTSGVGGADTNILDLSNLSAAQTVSLNGNTVKGISDIAQVIANNSLAFTLQVSAGTNTWNIFDFDGAGTLADGVDDGTVGSVQFVNFTNLQGGSGVDTFNINTDFAGSIKGGDEADVFNISAAAGSLDGEAGADSFVFFDGGNLATGVGGTGTNILDLSNLSAAQTVTVNGSTVKDISDIARVIANNALAFTLEASSGANTWTISDFDNAGSVADGVNDGTVGSVQFVNFNNLQGGDGVDTFNINTDFSGSIKGGAEADVFNVRATAGSVVGEDGDDSFVFFDSGSLSSGSGNGGLNSVDLSNLSAAETVTLNGATVKGVTAVGRVIANAGLNFTLQATGGTNTWDIYDFDGSGTVADGVNDGEVGGMQFINFKNLQGGTGVDTFNINTNFADTINGGDEADIFNIHATVGSLDGEAGDDSFVFYDGGSLTTGVGNTGVNTVDLSNLTAAQTVVVNGTTVKGISEISRVVANNSLDFTLQTTSGTNTWTISDFDDIATVADGVNDGTVGSVQFVDFKNLQGGSGVDTFNINTDFAGSIKGGDEADVFNISAAAGSLDGEAGDDSFVFFDGGSLSSGVGGTGLNAVDLSNLSIAETVELSGGSAKNVSNVGRIKANNALNFILKVASGTNTWTIYDFDGAGSVADGVNDGTVGTVQFVDFNNLQGGDGVDTFNINTDFSGSIKGGAETDVFNIRATAGSVVGEDGDDSFVFFDSGSLSSGSGNGGLNSVDLSNLSAAETVTLNGATVKGVTAVGRVIANAGLNFTLQATGGTNTWDIYDFDGSGTVADGVNDGEVGGMQFVNFKNLQGGTGKDTFNINTNFAGTIKGGDDADIFNIHATVGSLDGEAGDDSFVFYDGGSLTTGVGNTGVNTVDLSNLTAAQTVVVNGTTVKGISEISRVVANNSLDFTLQTTSGTNTWTISDFDDIATVADGVNDGTVGSVQFVDFKNLQGGSGVDTFNINSNFVGSIKGGDEADVFNISAAAGSLDGQTGDDSFVFFDGGSLSSGVGGTGLNAVDLSNLSIAETVELSGGSAKNVSNVGRIKANNALNFILKVASGTNTWTIYDFDGAGSVADGVNDGTVGTVQFVDFNNLQGGDGVDTFNINTNFAGSITGGAEADVFNIRATVGSVIGEDGDDSFVFFDGGSLSSGSGNGGLNSVDLSNLTAAETVTLNGTTVKGVTAVGRVIASAGLNFTLQATSGTNTWDIYDFDGSGTVADDVNDGTVGSVQFVNFKNLQGGSGVDTFNINTNFAGTINGGANNDQFNINAQVGTLGGDAGDDVFILGANGSVTTLEGGTDTDSLTGKDLNSTWNLTGSGSGSVALKGGAEYVHSFSQLETLNGGNQIDEFIVGTNGFISTINGGTGANALSGSSTNSTWTISSADQGKLEATAGGVFVNSFSGIQTLSGGSGIDIFNVNAAFTGTAQGGANNDIFNINASVNKVMGDAGDDSFILGTSGSLTTLEGGADTDSLTGKDLDSTWNLTGSDSGSVALKGGAAYVHSFSQIETLNGGNQADEFIIGTSGFINTIFGGTGANTLSGSSTNSTWTISSADQGKLEATAGGVFVNSFSGIQTLSGGSGIDNFNFNAAFIGAAQGGANNDIFNINASVNNVKGDAGDDSFILGTNGGLTTLEGGADNDSITGKDLGSSWNLTGSGSGSVALKGGAEYVHSFSQIETLNGGSQVDEFVVGSAGFMNTILGGLGDNTLKGSDTDSTWTISSADQGKLEATASGIFVNSFSGIQTLSGGSGIDQFNFNAAFTGTAQGGANNDIFNINAAINKVMGDAGEDSFTLGTNGSVTTLEGGTDSDSLTGKNLDSTWNLTGLNSGSVTLEGGAAYVTSFSQIETLNGGSQADEFVIGSAGYINHIIGGNGNNTLVAPNTDNNWNISGSDSGSLSAKTGASYVAAFDSIQNLTGNAALDKFTFASTGAISGIIDGGSSATKDSIQDEVDLKNIGPAVTLDLGGTQAGAVHIRSIEIATANSATSDQNIILGASDQAYIWTITGTNTGTIAAAANPVKEATLSFTNFGDLRGGTNNDTFNVTGGTAKNIAGGDGAGVDLVDYSGLSSNLIINLGSSGDFDSLGVNGIEGIKGNYGNSGGFSSTIKVADGDNTWVIGTDGDLGDGVNDGSVTLGGKVIYFENFTNINAGTGKDDFTYKANGQWLGMISGGDGTNSIDASAATKNQIFRLVDAVSPSITQSTTETLISGMTSVKANAAMANKLISADLANTWVVDAQGKGRLNDAIDFIGFSNLTGGAFKDDFTLANINQFTGVIDAGGGVDSIDLTGVTKAISVSTNVAVVADLKIANVEILKANNSYANRLIAQDLENAWSITGANSGSLNTTLGFSGFGILQGGSGKDKLVYASNAASLNGYINLGGGEDSLDTSKSSTAQTFYLRNTAGAVANGLALTGVETIIANGTVKNKLVGENASASWVIDGTDEGSVTINNGGTTSFTGIGNLAGGSADDTFTFGASGNLSGVIDGGDQTNIDLVDLSKSKAVNILITATGDKGFRNIEKYIGNSISTTLTADNIKNQWNLTGTNAGTLNQFISFENVVSLFGGNQADLFTINNASLTGKIDAGVGNDEFTIAASKVAGGIFGGAGNDTFNVQVASQDKGDLKLDGGADTNTLSVTGGQAGLVVNHQLDSFEYVAAAGNSLNIQFTGMSDLSDATVADMLNVYSSLESQDILLTNGQYQLGSAPVVYFANKDSFDLHAQASSKVSISGDFSFANSVILNNASINMDAGTISAHSLELINTQDVGKDAAIQTNVDDLTIRGANGVINIDELNALNIAELSAGSAQSMNISAGGDVTESQAIVYAKDLSLTSRTGDIVLAEDNRLDGKLSLNALGDINLRNTDATHIAQLSAQNLTLNSTGAVDSTGSLQVTGKLQVQSANGVTLTDQNNNFGVVNINAQSVALFDKDGYLTQGVSASGNVDLGSAGGIDISSCAGQCGSGAGVSGGDISIHSASSAVNVNANIAASGTAAVSAVGIDLAGNLSANVINLNSGAGVVSAGAGTQLNAQDAIDVKGQSLAQQGNFAAGGDINVVTTGDITMGASATTSTSSGDISYSGAALGLGLLQAGQGVVATNANKDIRDANGDSLNIQAVRWNASAQNGIGVGSLLNPSTQDAIETDIQEIAATNAGTIAGATPSSINIKQSDSLLVHRIINNGDISIELETGDLVLSNRENNPFKNAQADARDQGGVINANRGQMGGTLAVDVKAGSIYAIFENNNDGADANNPDILAENGFFFYENGGTFALRNRKMVMGIHDNYRNEGKPRYVVWYDQKPLHMDGSESTQTEDLSLQLIQIESLNEVDPAIFTNVRNYVSDEVAILMPPDQRFDSDDDEEGWANNTVSQ